MLGKMSIEREDIGIWERKRYREGEDIVTEKR